MSLHYDEDERPKKLDKFHYHEALHTCDVISRMISTELCDHWTYAEMSDESRQHLEDAQASLYKYYCLLCDRQDELKD
ncbi:hypothetical protein IQ22_03965 [Pseudomonas duriflava]|uniref:Rop-like protein n=1 Tax=Pseudomonas duriflava TaxID=459528 RepID=A0A562PYV8_9PSED|nr:hypothetical protein [Pseudomonas duriflava]TWI49642.1 hypothetical protein IQ22_03965 [Pseudomonas duriflava]